MERSLAISMNCGMIGCEDLGNSNITPLISVSNPSHSLMGGISRKWWAVSISSTQFAKRTQKTNTCLHSKGHECPLCLAGLECSARCLLGTFDRFPAANQGATYCKHSISALTALIAFQLSFLPLPQARLYDYYTKGFCHL